jgi:hypothetical protein
MIVEAGYFDAQKQANLAKDHSASILQITTTTRSKKVILTLF